MRWRAGDSSAPYNARMLVKFDSDVGSLTMFGDVAVELLRLMGHSGTVPSALLAADIPPAVAKLKAALAALPAAAAADEGDGEREPRVSLKLRAFPLLELLERASQRGADVLWDRG
jgi:hypothetical protein